MTSWVAALPPKVSRPWLAHAASVWALISASGVALEDPIASGQFDGDVVVVVDARSGEFGPWAVGVSDDGNLLLELPLGLLPGRGDLLHVMGTVTGGPGFAAGTSYGAVLEVTRVDGHRPSRFPIHLAGRLIRRHVLSRAAPLDGGRALLAGFLIGDTSGLDEIELEEMRRSGLTHFVAVSGSNVALFLGLLAIVAGPLGIGPTRRAVLGLIALPVFVAATGFEPSVIRAASMAGLALLGRLLGVVLEAWQLLALAVAALIVVDPPLIASAGFQLSVAATIGVLLGSRWPVEGRVGRSLAVTVAAQLAVAPLLVAHFGVVPIASPLLNLVAAPVVAVATMLGMAGAIGLPTFVDIASTIAGWVLVIAHEGAGLPQVGPGLLVASVLLGGLAIVSSRVRLLVLPLAALALAFLLVRPPASLPPGSVAVLDVGQGDSILVNGGSGHNLLVDGGPDPNIVWGHLRDLGVDRLDIVVLSHVHADHANGLVGLIGRIPIGELWARTDPHETPASRQLFETAAKHGIPIRTPEVGDRIELGVVSVEVLGPLRRYASPNDQSLVLEVVGAGRRMLLAGDIEVVAQRDLQGLTTDVLKVPHQGAATSDDAWLRAVGAEIAIISVGPNQFGHPASWVVDLFEEEGTSLRRTDEHGSVVVDLS